MLKYFSLIALVIAFAATAFAHDLNESIRMIEKGNARSDALLIKFKTRPSTDMHRPVRFSVNVKYAEEPAFPQTVSFLQKKGIKSAERLSLYEHAMFERQLTVGEATKVLNEIYGDKQVEFAYFEPVTSDAVIDRPRERAAPVPLDTIPDFESQQFYLDPPPMGIDARYGWNIPGATGKGVRLIDLETGWHKDHVEFGKTWWANSNDGLTDHGTAVWGEIAAKRDGAGVTGIAYDVRYGTAGTGFDGTMSHYVPLVTKVLDQAIPSMSPGDVLVIEQHCPGPDNDNYAPIEYWQGIFDILKTATQNGVVCVAAAGNGFSNLDSPNYKGAFDLKTRDSGCILVGAAQPPGATQLQKEDFSNYGSRVDAFGYGDNVVTSGYGDLFPGLTGQSGHSDYTNTFSGTSSATPIVSGAVIQVLGAAKAKKVHVTSLQIRDALRATGTPQKGDTTQRIGNMPDVKALMKTLFGI